jgi:hypothetical protein
MWQRVNILLSGFETRLEYLGCIPWSRPCLAEGSNSISKFKRLDQGIRGSVADFRELKHSTNQAQVILQPVSTNPQTEGSGNRGIDAQRMADEASLEQRERNPWVPAVRELVYYISMNGV